MGVQHGPVGGQRLVATPERRQGARKLEAHAGRIRPREQGLECTHRGGVARRQRLAPAELEQRLRIGRRRDGVAVRLAVAGCRTGRARAGRGQDRQREESHATHEAKRPGRPAQWPGALTRPARNVALIAKSFFASVHVPWASVVVSVPATLPSDWPWDAVVPVILPLAS